MKFLNLVFLFFISFSYAELNSNCYKAFIEKAKNQQFVETITRYFSTHKNTQEQDALRSEMEAFLNKGKNRKEILQYLIYKGYLTDPSSSNPLFYYILNRPSSEVIQLIREKPHLLYEGTLMDLPPFFLIVFIGDIQVMKASIEMDKTLVNSRNEMEEVPLHYSIDQETTMWLLYYNAKPDAQDKKGRAPLYNTRNPETAETILFYGADPYIRDRSGTPLIKHHEDSVGDQGIISLLQQSREAKKAIKDTPDNNNTPHEHREEEKKGTVLETAQDQATREEVVRDQTAQDKTTREETTGDAEAKNEEARNAETRKARETRRAERMRKNRAIYQIKIETEKNNILSQIAEAMVMAIILKARRIHIMNTIKEDTDRPIQEVSWPPIPIIITSQKKWEEELINEIHDITPTIKNRNRIFTLIAIFKARLELDSIEENTKEALEERLKDEIQHLPIDKLKKILRSMQKHIGQTDRITEQIYETYSSTN